MIFRHGPYGTDKGDPENPDAVEHVMIYLGNGEVVHASSPERGIRVDKFERRKNHSFGRYSQALTGSTTSSTPVSSGCQTPSSVATNNGYMWPVPDTGRVTSPFGYRIHPVLGVKKMHTGIDIAKAGGQSLGKPIVATVAGTVTHSGVKGSYGNTVFIDHGNGMSSLYAHCSELLVRVGETVTQGQHIANIGSTGRSTGPHLHFEIRENNEPVDPLKYVTPISE